MNFIDIFAGYWLFLEYIFYATVIIITLSSLDDLLIDIYYWIRRLYRKFFLYTHHKPFQIQELYKQEEHPLAIMIPAWKEAGVINKMAALLASTIEYNDYQIFIGTYPNDSETQTSVDEVVMRYPNIHKVVTANPGPTSKSDCLNAIVDSILSYEKTHNITFAAYIFHDAEDVIHPLELKLFNYLIDKNDMIQIPVIPFERKWYEFTAGHYADEFAEVHGKELIVRESMLGFVPSAGVGTAINRKALDMLYQMHDGVPFELDSLTEDYNMGYELFQAGMKLIFVRVPVENEHLTKNIWGKPIVKKNYTYIAVREFFPSKFTDAVHQKTRWLIGIVFQGWQKIGWQKGIALNYFLWRDRKAIITNLANMLGYFIAFNVIGMMIYVRFIDGAWWFPPFFQKNGIIWYLLIANASFFAIRLFHRAYFTGKLYGWQNALLSVPRAIWGNIINFFAMLNAVKIVISHKLRGKKIGWNKTTHDFVTTNAVVSKRLGDILLQNNLVNKTILDHALEIQKKDRRLLGEILIDMLQIDRTELAKTVAEQKNLPYHALSKEEVDLDSLQKLNRLTVLEYNFLPLKVYRKEKQLIVSSNLVSQNILDEVQLILEHPVVLSISESHVIEEILHHTLFKDFSISEIRQLYTILTKKLLPKSEIEKIIAYKNDHHISLIESAQHFDYLPTKQLKRIKL